jgi:signal transduction histidine kinase
MSASIALIVTATAIATWLVASWSARRRAARAGRASQSAIGAPSVPVMSAANGHEGVRTAREYAQLVAALSDAATRRIEGVRLPLHILLENHFGELNENQEEMLSAARAAADEAYTDLATMREIAELDLGEHPMRRDRVQPGELLDAIRPLLDAAAASAKAKLEVVQMPMLPAISGDRARLQGALVALLRGTLSTASPEARVQVVLDRHGDTVRISARGGGSPPSSVRLLSSIRIVERHGGEVARGADGVRITLPVDGSP